MVMSYRHALGLLDNGNVDNDFIFELREYRSGDGYERSIG
ncbi:hypothetical protein AB7M33_000076 [Pseudomonas sp. Y3 TE3536]